MAENFDILKYQFPPPGAAILEVGSSDGVWYLGNYRYNVLWSLDVPEGLALVLASVSAAVHALTAAVRGSQANIFQMRHRARAFFHTVANKEKITDPGGDNFPYLDPTDNPTLLKRVSVARPLPVYCQSNLDENQKGPLSFWTGPVIVGGPRTVAITAWTSINAGAIGDDLGNAQMQGHGWLMSDPDKLWKDSFR